MLSEILTNNAAGAVMYPIAATVGDALGISPVKASVAIMLGASAGFINPFSYQCNLMVYSAGNYTFKEFAIVGAPFQVRGESAGGGKGKKEPRPEAWVMRPSQSSKSTCRGKQGGKEELRSGALVADLVDHALKCLLFLPHSLLAGFSHT